MMSAWNFCVRLGRLLLKDRLGSSIEYSRRFRGSEEAVYRITARAHKTELLRSHVLARSDLEEKPCKTLQPRPSPRKPTLRRAPRCTAKSTPHMQKEANKEARILPWP